VEVKQVCQIAGFPSVVCCRRPEGPKPRQGLPVKLASLAVVRLVLKSAHLDAESGVLVCGLHLLRQVKLKLLREARVWRRALNRGQCVVSCWVTRFWEGMAGTSGCGS